MPLPMSKILLPLISLAVFSAVSERVAQTQEILRKSAPIPLPHTTASVPLDCSNSGDSSWAKVPQTSISKDSGILLQVTREKPLALEFLASDPTAVVTSVPADLQSELDSFHAEYRFVWDEQRLYGYVEVKEQN